ncbi:hypothetical protein HDU83_007280 [Entophlyctis luteolus]|nr:hypothetical protein HDU83_007280 [Entophlyctis luteolus]
MKIITTAVAALCIASVHALEKLEPSDGKLIIGAWYDSSTGPVSGNDTAAAFNSRIGYNAGRYPDYDGSNHNADGTANIDILNDNTNASVFLTVYPNSTTGILDEHITALANQCANITVEWSSFALLKYLMLFSQKSTGREVFLRFGPEMNGGWMSYGQQPTTFVALWKRVYTIFYTVAPAVALVWSPNMDNVYGDFPYAPYWPGAEFVDWVGLSIYWKGYQEGYPLSYMTNSKCPTDFTAQFIDATGVLGSNISFYRDYAVAYNKPFVVRICPRLAQLIKVDSLQISEGGGAFQLQYSLDGNVTAVDPGPGRTEMVMGFWRSNIFNVTFRETYPRLKMAIVFEMWKVNNSILATCSEPVSQTQNETESQYVTQRDYRVSVDISARAAFTSALKDLDDAEIVLWASSNKVSTSGSTTTLQTGTTQTSASQKSALDHLIVFLLGSYLILN